MTTIMDVAQKAGVSMKTVSRVVNGEPHVRPALRDKVLKAIRETDYRPNHAARQLAGNKSFVISFVVYDESNSYFARLATAAAKECRAHGYHLVSEMFDPAETGAELVQRLTARLRPDGIMLAPPLCYDTEVLNAIARSDTPLVRIAGVGEGFGLSVPVHDAQISCELVEHLISLGHRRIGMIAPPPDHKAAQERVEGYRTALVKADLPQDSELVIGGDFSFASGVRAAEKLLKLSYRPTAIFAANDSMALGALAVANRLGFAVPNALAVAGFNDSPISRMVFPPLTTVRQPIDEIARAAVRALMSDKEQRASYRHSLVIRGSTTGDKDLVLADMDV